MAPLHQVVYLALVVGASSVSPIDKVIDLIAGMKSEVESEGRAEAKAYEDFACFCKKTTKTKADSVKTENDNIDLLSADIKDKTQMKVEDSTDLKERKNKQVRLSSDLDTSLALSAKELAEYQVEEADYSKAISSMKSAIKAMKDSNTAPTAAVLLSIRTGLSQTLALANAMNIVAAPKQKALTSFLQGKASVDPDAPGYEYHSNDIVDLLENMLVEFKANKKELDSEHAKAKSAAEALQASLRKKMSANTAAMDKLVKSIAKLEKEIAKHREDLLNSESTLKDDEDYLKDLTARCEVRATDFDQRSSMREDEITALSTALKVLKDEVKPADRANERALFIQKMPKATGPSMPAQANVLPSKETAKIISFLQDVAMNSVTSLRGGSAQEDKKNRALNMLNAEGLRLNSLVLTSLAAGSAGDPFKKVKGLIQSLIERLLTESKNEATKKGFCDTELGKARKDRDFRYEESRDVSADLGRLEAKKDELTEEIKVLTKQLKNENIAFVEATKERKEEKDANMETLQTAKDGLGAVSEALQVLRSFYKQAAKASFLQASPVDEDTAGAGFSGSYGGNQSGSKAVLALLETIQSDFDRTLRTTEAAEHDAHREFVAFSQHSKSSIASKETKVELDQQDLKSTKTKIKTKTDDLTTAMDLLDSALKELEDLQPTCVDTGMSYSERVKKREQEMEALTKALCILDQDNVEAECK